MCECPQLLSPFTEHWRGNRGRSRGHAPSGLAAPTMAELQVRGTSPTRDLCAPRVRDGLMDEKAVKRANRLAGVGQAVGNMDLKAVAETYKTQNGGSGIEAAAAAAAALGAALKASMTGGPVDADECLKVAQKEMQKVATRKQREAKGEAVIASRLAAVGYEGQAKSEALRLAHQQRASRLVTEKNERLAEDVATRRAMREERAAAAASRRCLSEARARFVGRWPQPEQALDSTPSSLPSLLADDPVVRRAKALCSGAAQADFGRAAAAVAGGSDTTTGTGQAEPKVAPTILEPGFVHRQEQGQYPQYSDSYMESWCSSVSTDFVMSHVVQNSMELGRGILHSKFRMMRFKGFQEEYRVLTYNIVSLILYTRVLVYQVDQGIPQAEPQGTSTLAPMPELTAGCDAALAFQDWLEIASSVLSDVSELSGWWWKAVMEVVTRAYEAWLKATPLERLNINPSGADH
ncbi:hypothetical protein AK812_SmicGene20255 [Symbiodinium microadriaticum]|uniref:Uncharacterized protein n=1 Tax=Symbiodinium microadriaticum TaxID=2951 RepID=A0A1Q9DQG5_SYMMI|nr:hypothetical protein AK812_SmicGene20255 [Symbiodinium microadriaticum]